MADIGGQVVKQAVSHGPSRDSRLVQVSLGASLLDSRPESPDGQLILATRRTVADAFLGDEALLQLRCSSCGYGVSVRRTPDVCPMCRGTMWSPASRFRGHPSS